MPKKKTVKFTVLKSNEDGGFFVRVTHGSREITFFTETHKNFGDVVNMLMSHIEAIQASRYTIVDTRCDPVIKERRRAKKK